MSKDNTATTLYQKDDTVTGWTSTTFHPEGPDSEWQHREFFNDGVEQWALITPWPPSIYIERVHGAKSRRKKWCIVSRKPAPLWEHATYAPKLSGPYPNLEAAKAALLLMRAAGQLDM